MKIVWCAGSLVFSLAVSVKMNILLYAPALLIAYITVLGYTQTIIQVNIKKTRTESLFIAAN